MPALQRFEGWADRQLHRQHAACDAVFVTSDVMLERVGAAGVTRASKASVGVDQDLFRIVRRPVPGPRRILYAGRLDDDKEFGLVLDVLPDLLRRPDVRVTIAGAGKHASRLAAIEHPHLRYLGHVTERSVMQAIYALNDVLLAPGRYETFGLSALEGAAAGLVVVGPTAEGTGELLRECRSPLAFSPGCRTAFLHRIHAAIDSDHAAVIRHGRAVAARYGSWSDAVARHVAIYESLLGADEPVRLNRTA
jgi:glycosyltransferase involved in cell wall biosynthesis